MNTPTSKVEALREAVEPLVWGEGKVADLNAKKALQAFATFLEGFTEEEQQDFFISFTRKSKVVPVEALNQVVTALRGGE